MLEQRVHEFSSFWTLTYAEEHVPLDGSLSVVHVQLFLKRLRRALSPRVVRYYVVGEYGDETFRPHYHAALFGVSELELETVTRSWGLGHCLGGSLTVQSAAYIVGYVTKKMTKADDPRLGGKHPEFARMSLRPGIGALAMPAVAADLQDKHGCLFLARTGDVPLSLACGRRSFHLGRYLRRKLRAECGFETIGQQALPAIQRAQELHALWSTPGAYPEFIAQQAMTRRVRIAQIEGKARIFSKSGVL